MLSLPPAGGTLARARVPSAVLDAPIVGAALDREGSALVDLTVRDGIIAAITPHDPTATGTTDLGGRMVWPTLVDMHAHLDKGQVIPRAEPDGTLEGGARLTAADRALWTEADLHARMSFGLRCAYAHGVSVIRTHIDSFHANAERAWGVFRALRAEWAGRVELQGVAIAPLSVFETDHGERLARLVADAGGILGGVTDVLGLYDGAFGDRLDKLLDVYLRLAREHGLAVDLHVDQTSDTTQFALPNIARAVMRSSFPNPVVCGHCVTLALQPDDVARQAIALTREAGIGVVSLPTPMMYLQDRGPARTPRWRGVTLVKEFLSAGVTVAVAGDNCRDAWFPFGDHDMLDTLQQSVRVLQFDDPLAEAPRLAGPNPSDLIGAGHHGRIRVGAPADLIVFAARTLNEVMCRPQSNRIVLRRGIAIDTTLPDHAELDHVPGAN